MSWKKNGFSYFVWLVYTILVGSSLICVSAVLCTQMGWPRYISFLCVIVLLLLLAGGVFLLHKLTPTAERMDSKKDTLTIVLECLLVVVLLVFGAFLRFHGNIETEASQIYFDAAKVAEGQEIPQIVHGAVYFYLQLLHGVFLLLGNKLVAGIWLQIIMQMAACLICYGGVRRLAGRLAAVIMLLFLMCSPHMISGTLRLNAETLQLLLLSIAFFSIMTVLRKENIHPVHCIFTGLLIGFACYADIMGVTLLLFLFGLFYVRREDKLPLWNSAIMRFLYCVLGALIGFFGSISADALCSGKPLLRILTAWASLFAPEQFALPVSIGVGTDYLDIVILIGLMVLAIFSFWCRKREENLSIWVMAAIGILLLICFGMVTEQVTGYGYLYMVLAALAGLGAGDIFKRDVPLRVADARIEDGISHEKEGKKTFKGKLIIEDISDKEIPMEFSASIEEGDLMEVSSMEEENSMEEVSSMEEENSMKDDKVQDTSSSQEKQKVPRYFENPLPLPKKHEKKVLDYAIGSIDDRDDYDIDVDENDDFDIS